MKQVKWEGDIYNGCKYLSQGFLEWIHNAHKSLPKGKHEIIFRCIEEQQGEPQ